MGKGVTALMLLALVGACAAAPSDRAQGEIEMVERFVPHRSTAPANRGERVGLYLREKWSAAAARRWPGGAPPAGRVVLFVHGGIVSSVPDFDLPYRDYSWMDYLADAGFDVFAMDHTGYGRSPRPTMDDACNLSREDQAKVMPHPLTQHCAPSYAGPLTTRESDWDEIGTVVDFIRRLRGVERISLLGWSLGGPRVGGFAARHPEKVDKLFLYSPAYSRSGPGTPPVPRVPMRLRSFDETTRGRWQARIACEDQVDPGIREVIWRSIMAVDDHGAVWGPPEGVLRLRTSVPLVEGDIGWDQAGAGAIAAPTMIVAGAEDNPGRKRQLYEDLRGTERRVLAVMECASHYALWETLQHGFLHRASRQWLSEGRFEGAEQGIYRIGVDGAAVREPRAR